MRRLGGDGDGATPDGPTERHPPNLTIAYGPQTKAADSRVPFRAAPVSRSNGMIARLRLLSCDKQIPEAASDQAFCVRADDGNRTRMTSLEGWGSTIELHPRGLLRTRAGTHVAYRLAPVSRTPGHGHPGQNPKAYPERSRVSRPPSGSAPPWPRLCRSTTRPSPSRPHVARWPTSDLGKCVVRLADKRPKVSIQPFQVLPAHAPRDPRMVLTWPVIPASRCHVRMPDITGQSHLRLVPRLALDTCRRNGHASDQAQ
jgi:hypothetical protein